MSEKRRDSRGRILHNGEMQMSDGRYRYKYLDSFGKEKVIYSWRLDHNDRMPVVKKKAPSLREMENRFRRICLTISYPMAEILQSMIWWKNMFRLRQV